MMKMMKRRGKSMMKTRAVTARKEAITTSMAVVMTKARLSRTEPQEEEEIEVEEEEER
jgi:hypothetical protein